ncbi:MAG: bifunctional adenosylcobinamide kinase/adenosylcobinamide-phosphate guanylyltransferase [Planctomycetota bacterium]|jgi:adenosylcobinamide kinase/adenosylcobinamide-phosphate guanylyltransferase|nr:bifunctional adenosylcobinamide kinase/adenosylcobinamide-phosphate guanylyltransferase [Planctomycetota bacterium]
MTWIGPEVVLVLGGARSGKRGYALHGAGQYAGRRVFLATRRVADAQMQERVERRRKDRGDSWETVEEGEELIGIIEKEGSSCDVILIDGIPDWITNLMETRSDREISGQVRALLAALRRPPCPVYLVSGEVGLGVEPEDPSTARFRDLLGTTNRELTRIAREVIWVVAGIPVPIKDPRMRHIL